MHVQCELNLLFAVCCAAVSARPKLTRCSAPLVVASLSYPLLQGWWSAAVEVQHET